MIYYFSEKNIRGNHAGTKARNDVEAILKQAGAKPINTKTLELRAKGNDGIQSSINSRIGFTRYFLDLIGKTNCTVIIQYPMLAFDLDYEYAKKISKRNKLIFLIHDIQSLRKDNQNHLEKEMKMLDLACGVIVHNRFMEEKLRALGLQEKEMYSLQCFDYLCDDKNEDYKERDGIVFAGNLGKSIFLRQMIIENPSVHFNIYGPGVSTEIKEQSNVTYFGEFSPDEIPAKLKGKFGLVWDGTTTQGCAGAIGEYTKINNPHKMSLYIAGGIPIIAWKEAAISEFIIKNNIGLVVDGVDKINDVLSLVTEDQYATMKKSVMELREKVIKGCFLRDVLEMLEGKH